VKVLDRMAATGRQVRRRQTLQGMRQRLPTVEQREHCSRKEDENESYTAQSHRLSHLGAMRTPILDEG
jgi:hypothetical protein